MSLRGGVYRGKEKPQDMKNEQEKYFLPAILLLALGLRLHFLGFLYPYFEFNDEVDLVRPALHILRTGDLNPHFFSYGSFPIYWSTLLFLPALFVYWLVSGTGISFHLFLASFDYQQGGMFLFYLGRLTSVLFGVGSVYLVYRLGKELLDRRAGWLAALFLAVCPFHIYFSQLYKVDASFLFWFLLVIFFSVRIYREGGWKNYLGAGLFLGLVLSTRYNFVAFILILSAALAREGWRGVIRPGLWISAYTTGMVFLFTCPYAVLDFPNFFEQLRVQMTVNQQALTFFRTDPGRLFYQHYLYQLIFLFPAFFGPAVYLCSFPGFWELGKKDRRLGLLLVSYPLIFFVFFSGYSELVMPQYQIPFLPFAILGGSGWIASALARKEKVMKGLGWLVLSFSLVFSLSDLVVPHFKEIYYVYQESGKWVDRNIPKESKVLSYTWAYPMTNKFGFVHLTRIYQASKFSFSEFENLDPDYLVLSDTGVLKSPRFTREYREYRKLLDGLTGGELKSRYRLVQTFAPRPFWEWLAGMIYPDLEGFRICIYQKS